MSKTIYSCCFHGDAENLKRLLDSKANVNEVERGSCYLWKSNLGMLPIVREHDLGDTCLREATACKIAAAHGNVECLRICVEAKCNLDQQVLKESLSKVHTDSYSRKSFVADSYSRTTAIWAIATGHTECLRFCIEAKCNLDLKSYSRWNKNDRHDLLSALDIAKRMSSLAVRYGNVERKKDMDACVKMLEDAMAETSLFYNISKGNAGKLRQLIEAKADVDQTTCVSATLNCTLSRNLAEHAIDEGNVECLRICLEAKCNIESAPVALLCVKKSQDETEAKARAKKIAIENSDYSDSDDMEDNVYEECLRICIEGKCNIDLMNHDGTETAAMYAAEHNLMPCLKLCIAAKCNLDLQNDIGATAVMFAARHTHTDAVRACVAAKCNVDLQTTVYDYCRQEFGVNSKGTTAAIQAASNFQKHDKKPLSSDVNECLRVLIEAKCDINLHEETHWDGAPPGQTAIYAARNHANSMRMCIEAKSNIDVQYGKNKRTLAMEALQEGRLEVLQLLIDAQCDLNLTNSRGETPLEYANKFKTKTFQGGTTMEDFMDLLDPPTCQMCEVM